jgi:hypothetical protein
MECAQQFERDFLGLIKTHHDQWLDLQDESAMEAVVVGEYALFWFVADEALRRHFADADYHQRQPVVAEVVKEALGQAWERHLAQDLGAEQGRLQADLDTRFWDLREAYLHRLKAALGRGLDRQAALAAASTRLIVAMLMATIDEEVTQQAVVAFLKGVRRIEERLRRAYDECR